MKGVHLTGAHLRLPGYGADGPTLEIYNYNQLESHAEPKVNRPGFGHIAFEVNNVSDAQDLVKANGGNAIGEIVTLTTTAETKVTWCYMTDPEGNIIELQAWAK